MIEDFINDLMTVPEYLIFEYTVDQESVMLFVEKITPEQEQIPKTIDGKLVNIVTAVRGR